MKYKYTLLAFLLFCLSCTTLGNLNDPSKTVDIIGYPSPPKITSISIGTTNFDLTISSKIQHTGDLLGYNIYLTNTSDIISSLVSSHDLNSNSSPVYLLTNTIKLNSTDFDSYTLTQTKTVTGLEVPESNDTWHLVVTIVGSNGLYGSLQNPAIIGYIESDPSDVVSFQLRKTNTFTLENRETGSGNNGLDHGGASLGTVTGTGGDFYFHLSADTSSTDILPFFTSANGDIASLGHSSDFDKLTTIPDSTSSLYFRASAIPAIKGHVYAVYTGTYYYKFQITRIDSVMPSTTTNDPFFVSIDAAFVSTVGMRSF